jgi:hypothetical protein
MRSYKYTISEPIVDPGLNSRSINSLLTDYYIEIFFLCIEMVDVKVEHIEVPKTNHIVVVFEYDYFGIT